MNIVTTFQRYLTTSCMLSTLLFSACSKNDEVDSSGNGAWYFPLKAGNTWTWMEYVTDTLTTWPNGIKTEQVTIDSAKVVWVVTGSSRAETGELFQIQVYYPDFPNRTGFFTVSNQQNQIILSSQSGYSPFRYHNQSFLPYYLMHFEATLIEKKNYKRYVFSSGWQVPTALGTLPAVKGDFTYYQWGHYGSISEHTGWYFSPMIGVSRYTFNKYMTARAPNLVVTGMQHFTCEARLLSYRLN